MALFSTTCDKNKTKQNKKMHVSIKSKKLFEMGSDQLKTYSGFQCGQNKIYDRHPVFLYTCA